MEPIPEVLAEARRSTRRASRMQVVVIILIATLCVSIGETLLKAGMTRAGAGDPSGARLFVAAITTWQVLAGTALMALYFGLYSLALSRADISFVLPFTALSYLIVAVLARCFLHESVTPTRWVGALVIVVGVALVGLGERHHP